MNKVVLIGCGNVGMSYAYALVNQQTYVDELCLIDLDMDRVKGEVMDLNHSLPYSPSKIHIKCGTYKDLSDADICVICAGANQKVGETRMDLINKNAKIFKTIIDEVMQNNFKGVFIVATNPLDVMSYITWKYSGLPSRKVIGSGTSLDSARLKYLVGNKLGISSKCVNGYVIGEHGDSEFVAWSSVNIGLQNINYFLSDNDKQVIEDEVRNAAYEIINRKGNTSYGIGSCLVRITNAILGDEKSVLVVSTYDQINDVYVGLPVVLGRAGVINKIYFNINRSEEAKLQKSIDTIKDAINKIL